jgi:hypothetical protein
VQHQQRRLNAAHMEHRRVLEELLRVLVERFANTRSRPRDVLQRPIRLDEPKREQEEDEE